MPKFIKQTLLAYSLLVLAGGVAISLNWAATSTHTAAKTLRGVVQTQGAQMADPPSSIALPMP